MELFLWVNQRNFKWKINTSNLRMSLPGFESSQIFNLHVFASGIFGYLLNEKTTCIFNNFSLMNRNSEISHCFKVELTLSSLRLEKVMT